MKTILLTGSSSGIGKSLSFLIGSDQYELILLVKKKEEIKELTEELRSKTANPNITVMACDLSSQEEIEKCCDIIKKSYVSLDVLINNAAIYTETRMETEDKIEMNIAVNVLAPFILTNKLLSLLDKGSKSRVYNISSIGERYGKVDFTDIMSVKNYSGNRAYNKSKLLLTMLTYKFSKLYKDRNITFNCIHPGATATKLISAQDIAKMPLFLRFIFNIVKGFRRSPEDAAQIIYELITDKNKSEDTGCFFSNGKKINSSLQSRDEQLIEKTWDLCLQLTKQ